MFRSGDKVLCVDDTDLHHNSSVERGIIYTVTKQSHCVDGKVTLLLDEADNGSKFGYPYFFGYRPDRFVVIKNIQNLYS